MSTTTRFERFHSDVEFRNTLIQRFKANVDEGHEPVAIVISFKRMQHEWDSPYPIAVLVEYSEHFELFDQHNMCIESRANEKVLVSILLALAQLGFQENIFYTKDVFPPAVFKVDAIATAQVVIKQSPLYPLNPNKAEEFLAIARLNSQPKYRYSAIVNEWAAVARVAKNGVTRLIDSPKEAFDAFELFESDELMIGSLDKFADPDVVIVKRQRTAYLFYIKLSDGALTLKHSKSITQFRGHFSPKFRHSYAQKLISLNQQTVPMERIKRAKSN
ncbi:hypothetical protein [Enterovibrio norvegicus]|uniref:hypothetical protein n=1 Tax=Enterovibrio norvegicus TaxID=188144 RepID=UPI00352E007D